LIKRIVVHLQHTPLTPADSMIAASSVLAPLVGPVAFAELLMATAAQSTVMVAPWLVN
jgi:hypothetical protein